MTLKGDSAGASVVASNGSAAALMFGGVIGSSRNFRNIADRDARMMSVETAVGSSFSIRQVFGNWKNKQDRYLGLKFQINGEAHYGWLRLSARTVAEGKSWRR